LASAGSSARAQRRLFDHDQVRDVAYARPGIRMVTRGELIREQDDQAIRCRAGDCFFEAGDIDHALHNTTTQRTKYQSLEVLPAGLKGSLLMPAHRW
jgi:hypothetical protein